MTDEEQHCHQMLAQIRRAYEREAKPYIDMLVRIKTMKVPLYVVVASPISAQGQTAAKRAPDPEREAMAKVCEAARDMRDQIAYDISEAMRKALADLERAREGTT